MWFASSRRTPRTRAGLFGFFWTFWVCATEDLTIDSRRSRVCISFAWATLLRRLTPRVLSSRTNRTEQDRVLHPTQPVLAILALASPYFWTGLSFDARTPKAPKGACQGQAHLRSTWHASCPRPDQSRQPRSHFSSISQHTHTIQQTCCSCHRWRPSWSWWPRHLVPKFSGEFPDFSIC